MTLGNIFITVVGIVLGLAVARNLIPEEYGRFIYFVNVTGVVRLIGALGLTSAITYQAAKGRASSTDDLTEIFPLIGLRVFSLAILLPIVGGIAIYGRDLLLAFAALTAGIALLMDFTLGALQGLALLPQALSIMVLQPIAYGIGVTLSLYFNAPMYFLFIAWLVSYLVGLGVATLLLRPHFPTQRPVSVSWRKYTVMTIGIAGGYYVAGIFLTMFNSFATLIFGYSSRYEDAAAFTIPLNLIFMVPAISSFAMTTVIFPRLVYLDTIEDKSGAKVELLKFLSLSGILVAFATVCVVAFPEVILNILYGDLYLNSAPYLVIMAPIMILAVLGTNLLWSAAAEGRIRNTLPGVVIPVMALMLALIVIDSTVQESATVLIWFAIAHTVAAVVIFLWQKSLHSYAMRDAWVRIIKFMFLALVSVGGVRLVFSDDVSKTAGILAALAAVGFVYLLLMVKEVSGKSFFELVTISRFLRLFLISLTVYVLQNAPPTYALGGDIQVQVLVQEQASLDDLMAGGTGEAWLLYYLANDDPDTPRLLVHLLRLTSDGPAEARVYDAIDLQDAGPISVQGLNETFETRETQPQIQLMSPDGWWVRNEVVNYDLDLTVFGPISAMWGATLDVKGGPQFNWPTLLDDNEPNARIIVRDTDNDGFPDWDWRTMIPEFPNRGDYRTNYSERKCETPLDVDLGVFPEWPFVALDGAFEQEPGRFRPPIVVDWETGRIRYFSELVTVRNQNCSYSVYSIERVYPDQLNSPNFETPFAFYDLSTEGVGYPNLLLRTQRTIENEPFAKASNPETQSIRYSWRNAVGDWVWDYKIDVIGQFHYDYETPIAGGAALIDAPPYESFPAWVLERKWPAVSFVAREDQGYRSSEGIYEWSMLGLTDDYYFGWQNEPDLSQFADIRNGLRGEFRLDSTHQPETYLSAIDNRLHLKWAENGIWRLDDEQIIRLTNLDGDEIIDVWSRELLTATVEEDVEGQVPDSNGSVAQPADTLGIDVATKTPQEVIEVLYALPGHLLQSNGSEIVLVESDYEPILFEALPPTDHDTWETHRTLLAPYEGRRRDPNNLHSWLDAFPGPRSEIVGASAENVRITGRGFRFELDLEPSFTVSGPDLMGVRTLVPGEYLVEYLDTAFSIHPLEPGKVVLEVRQLAGEDSMVPVQLAITNNGPTDVSNVIAVVDLKRDGVNIGELTRKPADLYAGETTLLSLNVPSPVAGAVLHVRFDYADGRALNAGEISLTSEDGIGIQPSLDIPGISQEAQLGAIAILVLLSLLFSIGVLSTASKLK